MSSPLIGPAGLRPGSAGPAIGTTDPASVEQTEQTEAPVAPGALVPANVPGAEDGFGGGLAANVGNLAAAPAAQPLLPSASAQSLWGDSGIPAPPQADGIARSQAFLKSYAQQMAAANTNTAAKPGPNAKAGVNANAGALGFAQALSKAGGNAPKFAAHSGPATPSTAELVTQANNGTLSANSTGGGEANIRPKDDPLCNDLSDTEYSLYGKMAAEDPDSAERFLLQTKLSKISELAAFLSNIAKSRHDAAMSIIGNMR